MVDAGKVARSGMGEISSLRVVASRRVALALAGALLLSFVTLARPASAAAHLSPSAVSPSVTTCTTFLEEGTAGNPQQLGYAFGRIWMTETAGTTGYLEGLDPLSLSMLQFVLPGPDAFDGSGMDVPLGVVGGPDLRVWFVGGYGQGYARVGRIDPAIPGGAYSFINLPTGSGPTHIVYAPLDGAFWISASGSDSIIRLTPSGAFTVYPLTPGTLPWGITVGGDGAIWFAERGSGKIGRMLTTGVVTDEVSVGGDPRNIATGSGAVWFTKFGSAMVGKVDVLTKVATQLPTPTAASGPDGVTVDPAGAVWFTESSVGKVARIDPGTFPAGGSVTETSITVSTPQPGAMAALADGTVWFTENAPFIAHFKPAGDGSVLPLPPVVDLSISGATTTVGLDTIYSTSTTFGVSSTSIACVDSVSYRFYLTGTPEASKPAYTTITGASASFNLPSNGTWYIDYYATGPGGTIAAVTAGPFIVDDTAFPDLVPPVLTVADVTVTATGPLTPVTLAVSAIDAVDGVVPVYCAPASPYPPGVTLVTCSASDVAGNTATKTLTVTVVVPPPTLTVPTSVSVVATATLTPVPIPATASSVVDGAIFLVTCSGAGLTPGSAFTPGVVTVYAPFGDSIATCSISDAHGNTTSHAVAIHVAAPPPTMTLPADMTVTTFRTDGAIVTYTVTAGSIVYPSLTVTCVPPSGSLFPIGTTAVNCSAIDPEGNAVSGTFMVTVVRSPCPDVIVTLSSSGTGLGLNGGASLTVICGGVVVNSTSSNAISLGGGATLAADYIRVSGGVRAPSGAITPAPQTGQTPTADPYLGLPAPSTTGMEIFTNMKISKGVATLRPGVYDGGIEISGDKTDVTIMPGTYYLRGGGLRISGGTVRGTGVFFYNTLSTQKKPTCGPIDLSGEAAVSLEATRIGDRAGLLVHQDAGCSTKISLSGGSAIQSLFGTVYAPSALIELTGKGTLRIQLRLIADSVRLSGGARVLIDLR